MRTSSSILFAESLVRTFGKRQFVAVDDVSLSVCPGKVHALVGPNGAGKTTTVRMCSTLLVPTGGRVLVDGVDAVRDPGKARSRLGLVLGGELGFYPRATGRENLLFFADVAGVAGRRRRSEVERVLALTDLADRGDDAVGAFSRGMKQRLHIARALLGEPGVLILDEPTTGLDPDVSLRIRDLVRSLAEEGVAILMTSHSMAEIEELASRISVIGAGRIVVSGQVADVAKYANVTATTTATLPAAAATLRDQLAKAVQPDGAVDLRARGAQWGLRVYWSPEVVRGERRVLDVLAGAGIERPVDLVTRPATLEEAYVAMAERLAR